MSKPAAGLFIAGTNTEVGKTFVASQIARCLVLRGKKVGVYKPVASGCRQVGDEIVADDAMALWEAAGKPLDLEAVCPQRFIKPVAPHLAAKAEHRVASFQQMIDGIRPWSESDIVIVEGAGGLLSPISDDRFCADLAIEFGFPIVIVAANRLGVINETLQTLLTAARYRSGLSVAGIVLSDVMPGNSDVSRDSNWSELQRLAKVPCLSHVGHVSDSNVESSISEVSWEELAKIA